MMVLRFSIKETSLSFHFQAFSLKTGVRVYRRFVSRAFLRVSDRRVSLRAPRHSGVSILERSRRAWRREQSECSCNGRAAPIDDAKRRSGRGKRSRRRAIRDTRCKRPGATIDQRLIKFWRDRSTCASPTADSRIVFTPASIQSEHSSSIRWWSKRARTSICTCIYCLLSTADSGNAPRYVIDFYI